MSRLHCARYVIPTRRPLWHRITARIELAWCRYRLRCLVDEREAYASAGVRMGPVYLFNCEHMERELRSRIGLLECLL